MGNGYKDREGAASGSQPGTGRAQPKVGAHTQVDALAVQLKRKPPGQGGDDPGPVPGLSGGAQGLVAGADAETRLTQYVRPAEELSARVMKAVTSGDVPHLEGRETAHGGRDTLRTATRGQLSPGGRGTSEAIEATGPTIGQLADKYSMKLLEKSAELRAQFGITNLARGDAATERALVAIRESPQVSKMIIDAAGRPSRFMTNTARVVRFLGPIATGAQITVGSYRVLSAEEGEHLWTTGREISGFTGGTLGSAAGGIIVETLGAVAVGAGVAVSAPVAIVVSLVIIGGMAYAGDTAARNVWDRRVDHESLHDFEIELAQSIQAFLHAGPGALGMVAPVHGTAAGGGLSGIMERDRNRWMNPAGGGPSTPRSSGGGTP
jgi:hypothetical protein